MGFTKENIYDLAFVGSVLHALTQYSFYWFVEHAPLNRKVKILVIDKADEFWVGMGTVQGLIHWLLPRWKIFYQLMNSSF
jgi:hypothetical protein